MYVSICSRCNVYVYIVWSGSLVHDTELLNPLQFPRRQGNVWFQDDSWWFPQQLQDRCCCFWGGDGLKAVLVNYE